MSTESRLIFISGPESAGNRLMLNTLLSATNGSFQQDDDWIECMLHFGSFDAPGHKQLIAMRSMPHGAVGPERKFYDLSRFGQRMQGKGYAVRFVVPVRDQSVCVQSKAKIHTAGDRLRAQHEMRYASEAIAWLLESGLPVFLFSYETFMLLGKAYLDQLYRWLGVQSDYMPELKDGNTKYLKELTK